MPNKLLATPLYYAIEVGNEKIFQYLIHDKRTVFDWQDKFGDTILHIAAREGMDNFLRVILDHSERIVRIKNQ